MLTDLFTRIFRDSPDTHDEDSQDPGFTAFMEVLHARRSAQEWYAPGPEGDLHRQRCRDEEMMRLESQNYGFMVQIKTASTTSSKGSESSIASSSKQDDESMPESKQKRSRRSRLLHRHSSEQPKRVSSIGS